ncbi:cytochrome d ubiquinol oxidase subunit II [Rubritalea spongiae]|uniref:Cytochrome d ubiquinol oxidase subunit II n=1 Tax=Rubritalea spongiae TaxID=430797 RepID=A0ABW5DX39_9BACT
MIEQFIESGDWLPFAFAFLIGVSMLLYAILDGYDLGVGILSRQVDGEDKEKMISSIGPFWDANETWLVMGVGLLLVAFPTAHGVVLTNLYIPVTVMILSLVYRGVSYDFRKKVAPEKKEKWNRSFFVSSLLVALTQGYMVGSFVIGFKEGILGEFFSMSFGFIVTAGYVLMGSTWLIMKCEGELQKRALKWARVALWFMVLGAIMSSLAAVFLDTRIYDRMFSFPELTLLIIMPVMSIILTVLMHILCGVLPLENDKLSWLPFVISMFIFVFGGIGLVYSFYPYIIPGHLKITDAAAAPASLWIILVGTLVVFPFLIGYTALAYRIFKGKVKLLSYD